MASNDYYYGNQPPPHENSPSPAPYYNPQYAPSQRSTPAPSYHTSYPQHDPYGTPSAHGTPAPVNKPLPTGASPFDTVFDDHVYPMNSVPGPSTGNVSQQSLYHDTAYHGTGRTSPDSRTHIAEDIPLQDRMGKDADPELNDHIYDDPNGGRKRRKEKKPQIGLGQLGMFGSDRKRIPWVCYIFTIAQVGVFIGEIAQNGEFQPESCPKTEY